MSGLWSGEVELRDRLEVLSVVQEHFLGVEHWEHLLVDLLALLKSGRVARSTAVRMLVELIGQWPGATEVLEFTMRDLRWHEVRLALEEHVQSGSDFRTRDMASSVLEVYEDEWSGGEIYLSYS